MLRLVCLNGSPGMGIGGIGIGGVLALYLVLFGGVWWSWVAYLNHYQALCNAMLWYVLLSYVMLCFVMRKAGILHCKISSIYIWGKYFCFTTAVLFCFETGAFVS